MNHKTAAKNELKIYTLFKCNAYQDKAPSPTFKREINYISSFCQWLKISMVKKKGKINMSLDVMIWIFHVNVINKATIEVGWRRYYLRKTFWCDCFYDHFIGIAKEVYVEVPNNEAAFWFFCKASHMPLKFCLVCTSWDIDVHDVNIAIWDLWHLIKVNINRAWGFKISRGVCCHTFASTLID